MEGFKIRLSEKSTEILKELGPRLFSNQGTGASIEKSKKKLVRQAKFGRTAARPMYRPTIAKSPSWSVRVTFSGISVMQSAWSS